MGTGYSPVKTGKAEVSFRDGGGLLQAVDGKISQAVQTYEIPDLLN